MSTGNNAVYLSGWEYNRLLQDDTLVSRGTSLPTDALSNGGHLFWLFEKVYCAEEAFENELYGADALGWASGHIFGDLVNAKCLVPIDWNSQLSKPTKTLLRKRHRDLRAQWAPAAVRQLVDANDVRLLESLKRQLLEPIASELNCVDYVCPNSLSLWSRAAGSRLPSLQTILDSVAAPLACSAFGRGMRLCDRPGESVSSSEAAAFRRIQNEVERPMIAALYCGDGGFEGPRGFVNFYEALKPHADVYRAINTPVLDSWRRNRDDFMRLREAASKHIWPKLHGEWIPRLKEEPYFATEFAALVDQALTLAPIARHLELRTGYAFAAGAAAGALVWWLSNNSISAAPTAWAVGEATGKTIDTIGSWIGARYGGLPLFYSELISA